MADTQPLEVTLPDSDQAPVLSPAQVVLELGLCTPDDLWEV